MRRRPDSLSQQQKQQEEFWAQELVLVAAWQCVLPVQSALVRLYHVPL